MTDLPFAPPQNLDAEDRVLGSLITFYTPQLVHIIQAAGLKWVDFYREHNRIIYRAILRMHKAGDHVDTLTLTRFLECQRRDSDGELLTGRDGEPTNWLALIGGPARIDYLAGFGQVNGLRETARIVAQDGKLRRWLHSFLEGLEAVHARDEVAVWAAVAKIKEETAPGDLRVLEGGGEKAAA